MADIGQAPGLNLHRRCRHAAQLRHLAADRLWHRRVVYEQTLAFNSRPVSRRGAKHLRHRVTNAVAVGVEAGERLASSATSRLPTSRAPSATPSRAFYDEPGWRL
jgi:hypothetical protein